MDKDRDELLPCPFCGEKVISTFYVRDGRAVGCTDCAASLTAYQPDAEQKAIAAWNRRSAQPAEPKPQFNRPPHPHLGHVEQQQPTREWLITEISRLRKAITWYARENGDKRQIDEIVHAVEVCYSQFAAPPAAEQKNTTGDSLSASVGGPAGPRE